jgi:hypothetical protein
MLRFVLLATVLLSLPARAGDDADAVDVFVMPSGNVNCVHGASEDGEGIYCLRAEPKLIAVSFKKAVLDFGPTYGDQPDFSSARTFAYGEIKTYNDMTCWAYETGLECRSGKVGFRISRKGVDKLN